MAHMGDNRLIDISLSVKISFLKNPASEGKKKDRGLPAKTQGVDKELGVLGIPCSISLVQDQEHLILDPHLINSILFF